MFTAPKSTIVLLLAVLCMVILSSADKFDIMDSNHDGFLDRNEYSSLTKELRAAIDPFLVDPALSVDKPVASSTFSWDHLSGEDFLSGLFNSLVVIIVTEIGDKTFFIAAVLAMRNGRTIVYLGCMAALAVMHILSCIMGYALPALLPRAYTHYASALLFVYFGLRLLKDAQEMGDGPSEELQEVEEELIEKKGGRDDNSTEDSNDIEGGKAMRDGGSSGAVAYAMKSEHLQVFSQAFTLCFLAEWGDRSQIATIALASSKNPFGVIFGGLVGHALCTGIAVVGGRMLAARISERTVAWVGGVLFLLFAVHSFVVGP
ncbi:TMEM165 [Symbiodinium microadriaticum]|nr:TMEM165 [Symbiodinium microadriaticum]